MQYDDDAVKDFCDHLIEVLDQSPKRDILVVLGNWNAKVGEDVFKNWTGTCGCYCNTETNERGLRLLEFACYNDLVLVNTLGKHLVSRRWTWQSRNGGYHNQIDYIMVRRRFMTSVNTTKTRSFQGADIGSDHDLVMMSFRLHLKRCCDKCLKKICNKIWHAGEWPIPIVNPVSYHHPSQET